MSLTSSDSRLKKGPGGVAFWYENRWPVFWTALLLRLLYMTLARTYRVTNYENHFEFGWEAARIARALVAGRGYADPFVLGQTGPTAWLPPAYPLLIAASFKLFGTYTPLAAWAVLALNCLFSAATVFAIFEIAARCFNRRVALWSAWLWALYPAAMQYAVRWAWETSLTTMLFAWALVLALRIRGVNPEGEDLPRIRQWLLFGMLWGLIALSNPSLLLFLPVCGIWMLRGAETKPAVLRDASLAAILFLSLIAPWVGRNWLVFHAFIPMRGNFGAEFHYGNLPDGEGFPWGWIVVAQPDLQQYVQLGEPRYARELGQQTSAYLRAHPEHFLRLTARRVYFFWVSVPHPLGRSAFAEYFREFQYCFLSLTGLLGLALAVRRRVPAAGLFVWAFALLPFTYYFVTVSARFRHPLEPLIAILTVYLFQSAEDRRPGSGSRSQS